METSRSAKAELILDAAFRVLATEGYSGITIAKVAEEANVSRGLLHYYFRNKEDMLIQLMNRSGRAAWDAVGTLVTQAESPEHFADLATETLRDFLRNQEASIGLLVEVMAEARTNPKIRQAFSELYAHSQTLWIEGFAALKEEGKVAFSMPESGMANIFKALTYGMGLANSAMPGLADDEDTWVAFREMIYRTVS